MENILKKEYFLRNFFSCTNWEEKYLYIIELGNNLLPLPSHIRNVKYLIDGCQSRVWIVIQCNDLNHLNFYGDSDSSIIKGIIAIIFIFYNTLTIDEIINSNRKIITFFKKIELNNYLTSSRSNGIIIIINNIRKQVIELKSYNYKKNNS